MPYYMIHEEHGIHICYTKEDMRNHEKLGWVLMKDVEPVKEPEVVSVNKSPGRPRKMKNGDHNL